MNLFASRVAAFSWPPRYQNRNAPRPAMKTSVMPRMTITRRLTFGVLYTGVTLRAAPLGAQVSDWSQAGNRRSRLRSFDDGAAYLDPSGRIESESSFDVGHRARGRGRGARVRGIGLRLGPRLFRRGPSRRDDVHRRRAVHRQLHLQR